MIRRPLAMVVLLLLAVPTTAWAVPKVALTAIDGDSESEVRDAVAEALDGDDLKLVGKKETNRAADKIGDLSALNEKNAKKLAKDLAADAIIVGSLDKDGATRVLKFKLYVNGKAKKGFSIKFKSASSAKFKEALRKKMVEKLDGASTSEAGAGEDEPKKPKKLAKGEDDEDPNAKKPKKGEKPPKKVEKPAEGDDEEAASAKKPAEGDDEEASAKKPAEGDDEEAPRKGGKKVAARGDDDDEPGITKRGGVVEKGRAANHAAVRLVVGGSVVVRRIVFNSNLPSDKAPRPFKPGPVGGLRVDAELYPVALASSNPILSGIGFAFEFDRTAKMTLGTTAEPDVKISADQFHYSAGPRLRIVGKSATSPSVTLGVDFGRSRFRPDRSGLMDPGSLDLPDTYYKFISPGLGFRIPIGGSVAFMANGGVLLISDAGQIVRGYSYGQAKVFGVDTQAGLDILFAKRFVVRLTGEFTQIGYQFQGDGGIQANSRDGDPGTRDVGGAADRLFGGALTFGFAY